MVNFRDPIRMPRFPEPLTSERRSSLTNQAALAQSDFDVALWPESVSQSHSDIDIHLRDPFGNLVATSLSIPSVFERARVSGARQQLSCKPSELAVTRRG